MNRDARPKIVNISDHDVDLDPASRQKELKGWSQDRVAKAVAFVAGAGALGNELVKNLVLLGFKKIVVADFDRVVYSNLSRCIFFRKDHAEEKKPKAVAIAERAKELDAYGYVELIPLVDELSVFGIRHDHEIFKQVDLIFGALDNIAGRIYLAIASQYNKIPHIDGGMWGAMGNVFVSVPPDSPCYACTLSESSWVNNLKRLQCSAKAFTDDPRIVPSLPTTASIIAAIQVQEALKILHGEGGLNSALGTISTGKVISINLVNNDLIVYTVQKREDCPVCGSVEGGYDATVAMASEKT
ncbi:MAG: ThiF family adenylyltransferase [Candidatus Caldarchaeum sp.]